MTVKTTTAAILGSGPAGYTAGIYLGRAGLNPVIIAGATVGGQLTTTTSIENFPPFFEGISGFDLMDRMRQHAEKMGAEMIDDVIEKVDLSASPFVLRGESGDDYHTDIIVIATGAKPRWLGLASETKYKGRGVSSCATCDGFFYRGKKVMVVGGGSKALDEALYLANICSEVHLVHRRDTFRAEKILQTAVLHNPKIVIHYDSVVDEFMGTGDSLSLNAVMLKNVKTSDFTRVDVSGAFIAVGNIPNTEVFRGHLKMNDAGYIITEKGTTYTSVPGVFAAGDVQAGAYCQAIVAAAAGCMAAIDVQSYLLKKNG